MEPTSQTSLNHNEPPGGMSLEEEVFGEGNKKLNKAIESHVIYLLEAAPAQRMNRSLRKIFIDFLYQNLGGEPLDMEDILDDFYHLTNFLDTVQLNPQDWHRKEE